MMLSETYAVLEFSRDAEREKLIYVDEMLIERAKEFIMLQMCSLSDEEIKTVA
jgi:hypothetical protein